MVSATNPVVPTTSGGVMRALLKEKPALNTKIAFNMLARIVIGQENRENA